MLTFSEFSKSLFRRLFTVSAMAAAGTLFFVCGDSIAQTQKNSEIRVAVVNSFGHNISVRYFNGTVNAIAKAVAPRRVRIDIYDQDRYLAAAQNNEFDLSIASSGLTAVMMDSTGGTALLTVINKRTPDPNRANAGVIITSSDRDDIKSIHDLHGKSLAVSSTKAFAGFLAVFGELESEGLNPNNLFSTVKATHQPMTDLVDRVIKKEVDVAFVASCLLESMEESEILDPSAIKVINEKPQNNFYCKHSTRLYPGWILSTKSTVPSSMVRNIVEYLLKLPPDNEGTYWTIASDYNQMNLLLQRAEVKYLNDRTVGWALRYYRYYFVGAGVLLLIFILNWIYLAYVVRRRTQQLQKKIQENEEYEKENRQIQARIESLEKANTISMISGMVAHELKQPLAAINNYAEAILRKIRNNRKPDESTLLRALTEIQSEGKRAADIVDFVRGIGRKDQQKRTVFDAQEIVVKVIEIMRRIGKLHAECKMRCDEPVKLFADPLNVEIVLMNLIKNAQEAVQNVKTPMIFITIGKTETEGTIEIEDNGPILNEKTFTGLHRLGQSTKKDGLGLGLAIAQELSEANGGSLKLSPIESGGLRCIIKIPLAGDVENET